MALTDVQGLLVGAVVRDQSSLRLDDDWRQLLAVLADIAREASSGRVSVVKTRPGLRVPGVAHADLARALVVMSGYLWAVDADLPVLEQRPLLKPASVRDRQRALAAYGVLGHELGHLLCTIAAVLATLTREGFAAEAAILEEPRMEASMGRRKPWYRGCYGYAFTEYRLPDLVDAVAAAQSGALVDVALRTLGAEHGSLLHPDVADACRRALAGAMPSQLFDGLDQLCADLVHVPDGDVDAMRECCKRLRDLLQEEGMSLEPPPAAGGAGGGCRKTPGDGDAGSPGELSAEDIQAIHDAQQGIDPADWPTAREALDRHERAVRGAGARTSSSAADTRGRQKSRERHQAGIAGSPFDPVAGWRAPTGEEQAIAADLTRRLSLVPVANDRRVLMRYPPGTVDFTQLTLREAQIARGRAPSADPFARYERGVDRLRDPRVLVLLDTSGSMEDWIELATGMGWAIARAAVRLRGRVAMVGFGNQVTPIIDPAAPPRLVPIVESDGGTMFIRQAFEKGVERLDLRDPLAPRLLVVISDGDWHYPDEDRERLTPYLRSGLAALTVTVDRWPTASVGVGVRVEHPLQLGRVVTDVVRELVLAHRTGRPPRVRGAIPADL